jgi:hypothetical protein
VVDILVLFDVHFIIFNQDHCSFVAIRAAVIRSTEYSDYRRKCLVSSPSVHFVPVYLHLVGSDNRKEVVFLE